MKKKDSYWQIIRGLCIVAVILIHCRTGESYGSDTFNYNYWLILRSFINFPVAVFIFLSGYFTNIDKAKNPLSYYKNRATKLLIPYLVWTAFYYAVNKAAGNDISIVKSLLFGEASGQLYFIVVLIQLTLLTPLIVYCLNNRKLNYITWGITPLYLIVMYLYQFITYKQLPYYQIIFAAWLLFYVLGLSAKINKGTSMPKAVIFVVASLLLSIVESYIIAMIGLPIGFAVSQIKVSSFLFSAALINLVIYLRQYYTAPEKSLLASLGDMSFGVYFVHLFWLMVITKITNMIGFNVNILPVYQLIQFFLSLGFSVLSIVIIRKIFRDKLSNLLFGI